MFFVLRQSMCYNGTGYRYHGNLQLQYYILWLVKNVFHRFIPGYLTITVLLAIELHLKIPGYYYSESV